MIQSTKTIHSEYATEYLKEYYSLNEKNILNDVESIDWSSSEIQFVENIYYFTNRHMRLARCAEVRERNNKLDNKLIYDWYKDITVLDIEYICCKIKKINKIAIIVPNFFLTSGIKAIDCFKYEMVYRGFVESIIQLPPDSKLIQSKMDYNSRTILSSIIIIGPGNSSYLKMIDANNVKEDPVSERISIEEIDSENTNLLPSYSLVQKRYRNYDILLEDIADVMSGYNYSRKQKSISDSSKEKLKTNIIYPVSLKDMSDTMLNRDIEPLQVEDDSYYMRYLIEDKDILYSAKGAIFKSAMVYKDNRNLIATNNIYILRAKNCYPPELILAYINSKKFDYYIYSTCSNSYFKNVRIKDLLKAPVAIDRDHLEKQINKINNGYAKFWKSYADMMRQCRDFQDYQKKEIEEIFDNSFLET